jgi:putative phosphoribosyl transferase
LAASEPAPAPRRLSSLPLNGLIGSGRSSLAAADPALAGEALSRVSAPTLLIVGSRDPEVLGLNRQAQAALGGLSRVEIVPGAGHMFEEPGTLERAAVLTRDWFRRGLGPAS